MKLKAGIFDGLKLRELAKDKAFVTFVTVMNDTEKSAWNAFKSVVPNSLRKHKTADYECVISELSRAWSTETAFHACSP